MKKSWKAMLKVLGVTVVMLAMLALTTGAAQDPSAILGTYDFYSDGAITETTYSNVPYVGKWGTGGLALFVSASSSTTGTLTATLQTSYDQVNWVNVYTDYLSQSATDTTSTVVTTTSTTEIITSTGEMTATSTAVDTSDTSSTMTTISAWAERTYGVVLSSLVSPTVQSDYIIIPIHGLYMRVKMEVSADDGGTVTPVIKAVRW